MLGGKKRELGGVLVGCWLLPYLVMTSPLHIIMHMKLSRLINRLKYPHRKNEV
jgi:hypothetical protein